MGDAVNEYASEKPPEEEERPSNKFNPNKRNKMNEEKNNPDFIEIAGSIINIAAIEFVGKSNPEQLGYDLIVRGKDDPIDLSETDYEKLMKFLRPLTKKIN